MQQRNNLTIGAPEKRYKITWVNSTTGEHTELVGKDLENAINNGDVINYRTHYNRVLVDSSSGKPTTLTGDALKNAIDQKVVVPRGRYQQSRLVNSETGEFTTLTGDALDKAVKNRTVLKLQAFSRRRQRQRKKKASDTSGYAKNREKQNVRIGEQKETTYSTVSNFPAITQASQMTEHLGFPKILNEILQLVNIENNQYAVYQMLNSKTQAPLFQITKVLGDDLQKHFVSFIKAVQHRAKFDNTKTLLNFYSKAARFQIEEDYFQIKLVPSDLLTDKGLDSQIEATNMLAMAFLGFFVPRDESRLYYSPDSHQIDGFEGYIKRVLISSIVPARRSSSSANAAVSSEREKLSDKQKAELFKKRKHEEPYTDTEIEIKEESMRPKAVSTQFIMSALNGGIQQHNAPFTQEQSSALNFSTIQADNMSRVDSLPFRKWTVEEIGKKYREFISFMHNDFSLHFSNTGTDENNYNYDEIVPILDKIKTSLQELYQQTYEESFAAEQGKTFERLPHVRQDIYQLMSLFSNPYKSADFSKKTEEQLSLLERKMGTALQYMESFVKIYSPASLPTSFLRAKS